MAGASPAMTVVLRSADSLTSTACGLRCNRLADNGDDEAVGPDQAFGHALDVLERHRLDQLVALVHVIDAEVLDPDPQELIGDTRRGLEPERIGTRQIALGVLKFLGGWALFGEPLQLAFDHFERLADRLVLGRHAADEHGAVLIGIEVRVDRISKPALIPQLLPQPQREYAPTATVVM